MTIVLVSLAPRQEDADRMKISNKARDCLSYLVLILIVYNVSIKNEECKKHERPGILSGYIFVDDSTLRGLAPLSCSIHMVDIVNSAFLSAFHSPAVGQLLPILIDRQRGPFITPQVGGLRT